MQATENFYDPMHELPEEYWSSFRAHYGPQDHDQDIIEKVYGGFSLRLLFSSITFTASDKQIARLRATIQLKSVAGKAHDLILGDVSLRQFLVTALPRKEWAKDSSIHWDPKNGWGGEDHWDHVDEQYRLELCHSEISRWSILFKNQGKILGNAKVQGHAPYSRIELVNNCTTTTGFEFKVIKGGRLYHGSFGRDNRDNQHKRDKRIRDVYQRLSQRQAGSLAWQGDESRPNNVKPSLEGKGPTFFDLYEWTAGNLWDDSSKNPIENAPAIDLNRYRSLDADSDAQKVDVTIITGPIAYDRWGRQVEYYQKPIVRGLIRYWRPQSGPAVKAPPHLYQEIHDAKSVVLPNFKPDGVYAHYETVEKTKLKWLYDLDQGSWQRQEDGRWQLTLRRTRGNMEANELRQLVVGNLDLDTIPVYPEYLTLDRFGYGARPTTMDYDPAWRAPSDPAHPAHFAYLLGGKESDDFRYVLPEAFGVERILFSRSDKEPKNDKEPGKLTVDLIGFERILPVWQGVINLPS